MFPDGILGRDLEERATDWLVRHWDYFRNLLPGLFRLVMDFFKRILEGVDRILYKPVYPSELRQALVELSFPPPAPRARPGEVAAGA